jgi:hypothetical protein
MNLLVYLITLAAIVLMLGIALAYWHGHDRYYKKLEDWGRELMGDDFE